MDGWTVRYTELVGT